MRQHRNACEEIVDDYSQQSKEGTETLQLKVEAGQHLNLPK